MFGHQLNSVDYKIYFGQCCMESKGDSCEAWPEHQCRNPVVFRFVTVILSIYDVSRFGAQIRM